MELLCLKFVPLHNHFSRHVPVNGTSALARRGEIGETSVLLRQVRGEMGSACAVRESTEFAKLHGLEHSVWHVNIKTQTTSSRMLEKMFGLVVHVSKTLSLG